VSREPTGTGQAAVPAAVPVRWSFRFLIVWAAILGALEALVRFGLHTGFFLPAPSDVIASLGKMIADGSLATNLVSTLGRIGLGLLCGAGVGVSLGLAMGTSRRLRRIIDPLVAALHPSRGSRSSRSSSCCSASARRRSSPRCRSARSSRCCSTPWPVCAG